METIEIDKFNKDEIENCISCGKKTPYLKSTPIQERDNYVVGLGQVCSDCYKKLTSNVKFVEDER